MADPVDVDVYVYRQTESDRASGGGDVDPGEEGARYMRGFEAGRRVFLLYDDVRCSFLPPRLFVSRHTYISNTFR